MITARELAEVLVTYGDLPVSVQLITGDVHTPGVLEGIHAVHCEIVFDADGCRRVAVTAYEESV